METPPVVTPPVVTPPVETPPQYTTPPVETPPVETPPVETPPTETPNTPNSPPETPNTPSNQQGGGVLGQEQGRGGGEVVTASPAETTLPFTGIDVSMLLLMGVAFLGFGLVLHRVSAERG